MAKVNNGYQQDRDFAAVAVDSLGWGTNDQEDGAGPSYPIDRLGNGVGTDAGNNEGGQSAGNSYWKSGVDVTTTTGGDGTANPWWQKTARWEFNEISEDPADRIKLYESGAASGSLTGTNPAGNDGTTLYLRTFLDVQTKTQNSAKELTERLNY